MPVPSSKPSLTDLDKSKRKRSLFFQIYSKNRFLKMEEMSGDSMIGSTEKSREKL